MLQIKIKCYLDKCPGDLVQAVYMLSCCGRSISTLCCRAVRCGTLVWWPTVENISSQLEVLSV